MPLNSMDRRSVLRTALGAAGAAAAVTVIGAGPAAAHGRRPQLPKVEGLVGDRWASEFWYDYDQMSYYTPSDEMKAAVGAITAPFGGFTKSYDAWAATRKGGRYPRSWMELIEPNRAHFEVLSRCQKAVYDKWYHHDPKGLVFAFQEFGQGTLFDPRRPAGNKVHMMNFTPPDFTHAYHRWHPYLQSFQLLGIDRSFWAHINRLVGAAWELQSLAQPKTDANDNKHLPKHVVNRVTAKWLVRSNDRINKAFDVWPYPVDLSK
ncbi:Tat pathway signal sequence domain protein [Streptomyces sp. NBC_00249]|uniref:Tat pathway signal sequence domain protein n=1 Tax=Streptomyces sp. NBC_00249 TaxID=2975690 RepID=UPI00224F03BF|nr:Tat pathway signal sequence domain protein [Streptomyces sp. NBC_00249]MCX5193839.1 Tat pathway signal sequence domain protein [Streptomyces sp. NBC_00249]